MKDKTTTRFLQKDQFLKFYDETLKKCSTITYKEYWKNFEEYRSLRAARGVENYEKRCKILEESTWKYCQEIGVEESLKLELIFELDGPFGKSYIRNSLNCCEHKFYYNGEVGYWNNFSHLELPEVSFSQSERMIELEELNKKYLWFQENVRLSLSENEEKIAFRFLKGTGSQKDKNYIHFSHGKTKSGKYKWGVAYLYCLDEKNEDEVKFCNEIFSYLENENNSKPAPKQGKLK